MVFGGAGTEVWGIKFLVKTTYAMVFQRLDDGEQRRYSEDQCKDLHEKILGCQLLAYMRISYTHLSETPLPVGVVGCRVSLEQQLGVDDEVYDDDDVHDGEG